MAYIGGKKVGEAVRPASFISKTITLSLPGRYFASLDACDGYSQVYVTATEMPTAMRQFVVGDETVTTLILSNDVTNVVGCLQSFPNLNLFVVTNVDGVVTFANNTFSGTKIGSGNGTIIVPNHLKTEYEATYPQYIFDSWIFEIEFTIPFIGETTLTAEYVRNVVANAGGNINIVTKVIVPPDFTEYEDGVIDTIKTSFANMNIISIGYTSGDYVDFDLNSEIVAEIEEVDDLGNAIEYSKEYERTYLAASIQQPTGDDNLVIMPPLPTANKALTSLKLFSNLVYIPVLHMEGSNNIGNHFVEYMSKLIEVNIYCSSTTAYTGSNGRNEGLTWSCANVKTMRLIGYTKSFSNNQGHAAAGNNIGHDGLVILGNSLGNADGAQTATLGAGSIATLTEEEKAIFTNKGYTLQ